MHESLAQSPEDQLLGLLSGALLNAPANVQTQHGYAPLETEEIATDFVPADSKIVLIYVGDPNSSPAFYYLKTDAHDPKPFQMPNGQLTAGETFNVTGIRSSENGLVFDIGHQDQSNGYFYANSLDDLSVKVVEKTDAERAQDQLHEIGRDIDQYDYLSLMAQRYQEAAERLLEAVEDLPVFEIDSPCRYSVDSSFAGALYRLNESEALGLIAEWTFADDSRLTSKFFGNRVAVVDDKIVLIDDETNLAMGTVVVEERYRAFGFSYPRVVDTSSLGQSSVRDNSALQQRLLESS